tara:strand:- start:760 stop:1638 length:879 start_codon:yes stop_codon:yes gene_type:complete
MVTLEKIYADFYESVKAPEPFELKAKKVRIDDEDYRVTNEIVVPIIKRKKSWSRENHVNQLVYAKGYFSISGCSYSRNWSVQAFHFTKVCATRDLKAEEWLNAEQGIFEDDRWAYKKDSHERTKTIHMISPIRSDLFRDETLRDLVWVLNSKVNKEGLWTGGVFVEEKPEPIEAPDTGAWSSSELMRDYFVNEGIVEGHVKHELANKLGANWEGKIPKDTLSDILTRDEWQDLFWSVRNVISRRNASRGHTVRDFLQEARGKDVRAEQGRTLEMMEGITPSLSISEAQIYTN